jgi:hypothetical protein
MGISLKNFISSTQPQELEKSWKAATVINI